MSAGARAVSKLWPFITGVGLLLAACSVARTPENHGTPLADLGPDAFGNVLFWTPDDTRVAYLSQPQKDFAPFTLYAVDIATREQRILLTRHTWFVDGGAAVAVAADGDALILPVPCEDGSGAALARYSLTTKEERRVSDCTIGASDAYILYPFLRWFVLFPDGLQFAYAQGGHDAQSTYVYDLTTDQARLLSPGVPVAASLDGHSLLLRSGEAWLTVDTQTGASEALELVLADKEELGGLHWHTEGIYGLAATPCCPSSSRLFSYDFGAAATRTLWSGMEFGSIPHSWSPDGSQLALSRARCIQKEGVFGCARYHSRLYLVDLTTGADIMVAEGSGVFVNTSFSHEGGKLVYLIGGKLYLRTLH